MKTVVFFVCFLLCGVSQAQHKFTSADVTLRNEISGTLLVSQTATTPSVVLFIAGSGPTDRDGNSGAGLKTDCTKQLAEALAAQGIASLRFDKRGIARSTASGADEKSLRIENFVDDVVDWIDWLRDRQYKTIVLAGHSEGSLIGILAALKHSHVRAFISMAGSGRSADELILEQVNKNPFVADFVRQEINTSLARLKQGATLDTVPPHLMTLFRPSVQPYLISWFRYDPAAEIKKLPIPVLIVQGTTDLQVSEQDAHRLHQANPDAQLIIIPGMNHILKDAPPEMAANLATYQKPDAPLSASLVPAVVAFIRALDR
jgi:uncharacterized protein